MQGRVPGSIPKRGDLAKRETEKSLEIYFATLLRGDFADGKRGTGDSLS
jgi:hypothetical protein